MTDTTYNGWKNYETWLVNLWLTNEQDTLDALTPQVLEAERLHEAADILKEYVAEMIEADAPSSGLARDLLNAALARVDWQEIAKHWRDEAQQDE